MTERKAAIAEEQRAVDHAYTCYERKFQNNRDAFRSTRRELTDAHAGTAFITDVAPEIRFESDLGGEALVIARVDDMEDGKPKTWYIGRRPVRDEDHDAFVIDWQTPQAIDWMLRRPDDPGKMTLRRLLRCEADRVRDFRDEIRIVAAPSAQRAFTASALAAGEPLPPEPDTAPGPPSIEGLKDFLLEDLERARDGRMRDIVETIQRDQLLLVSDDRKGVLIVQGGPGTGKTAVGLHRISWLLFNERFKTGDVLVVGPHRRFLDYVRGVLPRLGTRDVTAVELDRLWDAPRGVDPLPARLVKSDARMAEVLRRAVDALPHHRMNTKLRAGAFEFNFEGGRSSVPRAVLEQLAQGDDGSSRATVPYATRRRGFAARLVDHLVHANTGERPRRPGEDVRSRIARDPRVVGLVKTIWPDVTAEHVLRGLLGDPEILRAATDGLLSEEERAAIARTRASRMSAEPWSPEDRVCLEELRVLIGGDSPPRYRHIVVDEAQDLSPMQARSLARRCPSGSMTVLGDLTQATGGHPYHDWSALASALAGDDGWHLEELTTGYRVPSEVMEFAEPLARSIPARTKSPTSIRPRGAEAVTLLPVRPANLVTEAAERVRTLTSATADEERRSVAVIVPADRHADTAAALTTVPDDGRVSVITAAEAKGLEFDHVVLVEPAAIAGLAPAGPSLLYVALTRCTRSLTVVHSAPIPRVLLPVSDISPEGECVTTSESDQSTAEPELDDGGAGFAAFVGELEASVRAERRCSVHERVRHALISELYGARLLPVVDSPTADVICDGPDGRVLYEVLGEGGDRYRRMRDAVLRIHEVQHAEGEPADHRFLVLPCEPAESWAPGVLREAFGLPVLWRTESGWDGQDLSLALGRSEDDRGENGKGDGGRNAAG
ncbi:HelD family protein [Spirillospora sp. NBC_01491]|uniref:HelD family protein n=1 Tax=Spirillospora sp. NBC_01491 TaxID=2976007 RepID=UPI002E2EF0A6|nr:DNA/RNA helicase [Spirillospora sp. NBC_01491]